MKKIATFIIKNTFSLSLVLLAASVALIATGALFPRHENYYPALLCIIASCVLLLLMLSGKLRSEKAFILSLFNLLFITSILISSLMGGHIILAATDWHLGATISLLYIIETALYLRFFRNTISGLSSVPVVIYVLLPVFAAGLFYSGVKAWIGLAIMVSYGIISVITIKKISVLKN